MKFFSSYNPKPSKAHEPCPKDKQDYILDEDTGELVPSGRINTYERTQSYHESCTLSFKLKRFAMGEATALGSPVSCDIDLSGVPGDLRSILDSRKEIVKKFSAFPAELRNLFNNSFEFFEESVRQGSADKRIADFLGELATKQHVKPPESTPTT